MLAIYYGNCQIVNLNKFLKLEKSGYNVKIIDCTKTEWDISKLKRWINRAKLIIMSYIRPNYRNRYYLSSQFIVQHAGSSTKIIVVPCIYFPLYHIDALTIKFSEYDMLKDPDMHHYHNLLKSFIAGKSVKQYIEEFSSNQNLHTNEQLENFANKSIEELKTRQNVIKELNQIRPINLITIDKFIQDNYKDKVLFHTYHHPTTILYLHVVEQIVKIVGLNPSKINTKIDPLSVYGKMYIYESTRKILNFDVDKYNTEVLKRFNNSLEYMVERYYIAYKKKGNKKYIEHYKKNKLTSHYQL